MRGDRTRGKARGCKSKGLKKLGRHSPQRSKLCRQSIRRPSRCLGDLFRALVLPPREPLPRHVACCTTAAAAEPMAAHSTAAQPSAAATPAPLVAAKKTERMQYVVSNLDFLPLVFPVSLLSRDLDITARCNNRNSSNSRSSKSGVPLGYAFDGPLYSR